MGAANGDFLTLAEGFQQVGCMDARCSILCAIWRKSKGRVSRLPRLARQRLLAFLAAYGPRRKKQQEWQCNLRPAAFFLSLSPCDPTC